MIPPREVPPRDDYYMGLAFWVASRSKDPSTQVGAVIVSRNNEPISTGYNGPPRGISDDSVNWERPAKYDWVVHAESNAIKHAQASLAEATVYVTAPPCKKCMLELVVAGVRRIVYYAPKNVAPGSSLGNNTDQQITQEIAKSAGVSLESFQGTLDWMQGHLHSLFSTGYIS